MIGGIRSFVKDTMWGLELERKQRIEAATEQARKDEAFLDCGGVTIQKEMEKIIEDQIDFDNYKGDFTRDLDDRLGKIYTQGWSSIKCTYNPSDHLDETLDLKADYTKYDRPDREEISFRAYCRKGSGSSVPQWIFEEKAYYGEGLISKRYSRKLTLEHDDQGKLVPVKFEQKMGRFLPHTIIRERPR